MGVALEKTKVGYRLKEGGEIPSIISSEVVMQGPQTY